ncbi:ATP-binding cassette domain-containing protein [Arthrobacter sp. W4I7]|uniref:ATP-binding cassette domain-containing protein n=1 Tax=Arthrobacter sp. W4I7 TaxID=3042296 RepID=UPI00278339BC|nr:ATP-binding cassette domain-containing protein [Arthrobacter sp. W4I7]MDQ0693159.1 ABC-type oligopeptide transport system ATPase subunit [Arthrobacter sp. W4I7]
MLLTATNVSKTFGRLKKANGQAHVKAVDEVTVSVAPGDFTAVVGESGSGKSTVARMLLGLIPPDEGTVTFDGVPLAQMSRAQTMKFRSSVQCVLQDPSAALNPRKSVHQILSEVIRLHGIARGREEVEKKVHEALEIVDLKPAQMYANRYPHQLSGGQRQRVLIARAVILRPSIIIADEAVSALDVSVKAGILNLLNRLRTELNIGYLFITHDLPVVNKVADEVYVMKSGKIVEHAPKKQLFLSPATLYTQELLASAPVPDPRLAREWIRSAL